MVGSVFLSSVGSNIEFITSRAVSVTFFTLSLIVLESKFITCNTLNVVAINNTNNTDTVINAKYPIAIIAPIICADPINRLVNNVPKKPFLDGSVFLSSVGSNIADIISVTTLIISRTLFLIFSTFISISFNLFNNTANINKDPTIITIANTVKLMAVITGVRNIINLEQTNPTSMRATTKAIIPNNAAITTPTFI